MVTRLLRAAYNDWVADRVPQTAAGLAYYTVFSLAPLLLIATGIAGLVFGHDQARAQILDQVTAIMGSFSRDAVERLMGSEGEAQRAGLVSTVTGGVTLLIGAVGVLVQLKYALNAVWNVESSAGTWGDTIRMYLTTFALVLATGFLLLVSLVLTAVVGAATSVLHSWLSGPDLLWAALDAIVGLAMATGVFALIFKMVPDTDVAWRDVWSGALFTALLFTAGRLALGWYLGRAGADSVYSAAGSLLAMLTWVYYSAQIVLFGAEFTHVYAEQHGSRASRQG